MPGPFWEPSNNAAFHGYLKFVEFQKNGIDLHATFQKDKKVHISAYDTAKKIYFGNKIIMEVTTDGLYLNMHDFLEIKIAVGVNFGAFPAVLGYKDYETFFLKKCNEKYVELNIGTEKPKDVAAEFNLKQHEWPSL